MNQRPCLSCGHPTYGSRCAGCQAAFRGTTTERGYGYGHNQVRAMWAPDVATGTVRCARCGVLIAAGAPWDVGHDDHDRRVYAGPEHQDCNRGTNRGSR